MNEDKPIYFVPNQISYKNLELKPYKKETPRTIFAYCGQWKLLIGTIQFLVEIFNKLWFDEKLTIVYIGAAPGLSIPIIHMLFGEYIKKWILYDKGVFCNDLIALGIAQSESFEIRREYFSDKCVETYDSPVVILDDHRTDDKSRDKIIKDFQDSSRWVRLMINANSKFSGACIKFRLPWPNDNDDFIEGIGGEIVLQPWTAKDSVECRLIVSDKISDYTQTTYNLQEHEQKMFQYNTIDRWQRQCELHNINLPGLDRGQDSQITISTCISAYKLLHKISPTVEKLKDFIMILDSHMPRRIADFPTAVFPQLDWFVRIKQKKLIEAMKREYTLQNRKKKIIF
jgi:hypothetical protein